MSDRNVEGDDTVTVVIPTNQADADYQTEFEVSREEAGFPCKAQCPDESDRNVEDETRFGAAFALGFLMGASGENLGETGDT